MTKGHPWVTRCLVFGSVDCVLFDLQDAAVSTGGRHMAGLVEEPESLPLFSQRTQIFRRIDQLTGSDGRIGVVDRQEATDVPANEQGQHNGDHETGSIFDVWGIGVEHESNPCWCY